MPVLTIGRVFDTYDVDVSEATWSGNVLTLAGTMVLPSSVASRPTIGALTRDRLLSLTQTADEATVPVTWTQDPTIDGFYRPLAVRCDYQPASLNDGTVGWSVDLERVGRGALPQHEVTVIAGSIDTVPYPNSTIATAANHPIIGIPGTAYDIWNGFTASTTSVTRTTETGTVGVGVGANAGLPKQLTVSYTVAPADAYIGACTIKGTVNSVADQLILGRSTAVDARGLTISNGFIRAKITAAGVLSVELRDAAAWVRLNNLDWTMTRINASSVSTTLTAQNVKASIIRNSPEQVAVRLVLSSGLGSDAGRVWLDIGLARGLAALSFRYAADVTMNWQIQPSASVASDSATVPAGLIPTANDANGNRHVLIGHTGALPTPVRDTVTGHIRSGALTKTWPFTISAELDGTAAVTPNQVGLVRYEFFEASTFTQRVVTR